MIRTALLCLLLTACATPAQRERQQIDDALRVPTAERVEAEISAAFRASEWTRAERLAFTASALAHAADLYTSMRSNHDPSKGPFCREANPILGDNPSAGARVAVKLVAIGLEAWIYSTPGLGDSTHWYGIASAALVGATAWSNTRNDCYGVGR